MQNCPRQLAMQSCVLCSFVRCGSSKQIEKKKKNIYLVIYFTYNYLQITVNSHFISLSFFPFSLFSINCENVFVMFYGFIQHSISENKLLNSLTVPFLPIEYMFTAYLRRVIVTFIKANIEDNRLRTN